MKIEAKKETARLRYLRMAPRKVRAVANLIRGLSINEAEARLSVVPRRASQPLLKLIRSAAANAKNNRKMEIEKLVIEKIEVGGGPMLKRFLPRARGSASPIQKKSSHVAVILAESEKVKSPRFKFAPKAVLKKSRKESRKPAEGREKEVKELKAAKTPKEGFFRKIFRRKAI